MQVEWALRHAMKQSHGRTIANRMNMRSLGSKGLPLVIICLITASATIFFYGEKAPGTANLEVVS